MTDSRERARVLARLLVRTALEDAVSNVAGRRKRVQEWVQRWEESPGGAAWAAEELALPSLSRLCSFSVGYDSDWRALRRRICRLPWA